MVNAMMIAFRIVPIPGISRIGIHSSSTATLTRNVASPIVELMEYDIPSARTVQGVLPIPAAMRNESPQPENELAGDQDGECRWPWSYGRGVG